MKYLSDVLSSFKGLFYSQHIAAARKQREERRGMVVNQHIITKGMKLYTEKEIKEVAGQEV